MSIKNKIERIQEKFEKEKSYSFDAYGYAAMIYDQKMKKIKKISSGTSLLVLIGLLGFGILSKEFFAIYAVGQGIDFVTDLMVK